MKGYIYKNVSVLFFIAMAISIMIAVTGCGDAGRVLPLGELENLSEEQMKEEMAGVKRDEIIACWGEPVSSLSGMYGDIYGFEDADKYLIVYYSGEDDAVETVKLDQIEPQREPPALKLSDTLSSTLDKFEVTSGNYTWNYLEGGAMTGVNACGAHPLYEAKDKERLTIPQYNNLDSVSYSVSVSIKPDRITINEYSIEDLGNTDASPLSSKTYEDVIMPGLKNGRVYELTAEWDEENLEKNRCYGTAGYVVVTDSRE